MPVDLRTLEELLHEPDPAPLLEELDARVEELNDRIELLRERLRLAELVCAKLNGHRVAGVTGLYYADVGPIDELLVDWEREVVRQA